MKRPISVLFCLSFLLASGVSHGATQGYTSAERQRANELYKRLIDRDTPKKNAAELARVYLRRAYVLDVGPGETIANELQKTYPQLADQDRLWYFAWALDALIRGAKLKDLQTTLEQTHEIIHNSDERTFFVRSVLGVASCYASPVPILEIVEDATDDGMMGEQRRKFVSWIITQVKRGENPVYIQQIYDVVSDITPLPGSQRDLLDKCYRAVHRGVPPDRLADAVKRMGENCETGKQLEGNLDNVLRLFYAGVPFEKAVDTVAPPTKKAERKE